MGIPQLGQELDLFVLDSDYLILKTLAEEIKIEVNKDNTLCILKVNETK